MLRWLKRLLVLLLLLLGVAGAAVLVLYRVGAPPEQATSIGKIHARTGFPVELTEPHRMDFTDYLVCDGSVVVDVRAVLRAKVAEEVEAVHVRVGEPVEKGQLLVEFRKTDLEAEIQAAQTAHEEAVSNYERYKKLVEKGVLPVDRLEQARTAMENAAAALRQAKSRLSFAEVHSPISGYVETRMVEPGEFKGIGKDLLTIVDLSTVEVRALVPEQEVAGIAVAQKAEFQLESGPTWHQGTVSRIAPSTQDPNRFFDVYLKAENRHREGKWLMRPGMFAEVRFVRSQIEDALALPATAVVYRGQSRYVFVAEPGTMTIEVQPKLDNPGPEEEQGLEARLRRGLKQLKIHFGLEEPPPVQEKEVEVLKARSVEVRTGLRSGRFVQLPDDPLDDDARVVLAPQEALEDDTAVRPVGGGEGQ